ncbi:MAG: hypothetical protein ACYTBJ_00480 [Planctomycetota bacterium]|jgi:hypothetical protein
MWKTRENQVTFRLEKVVNILMVEARKKWKELPKEDDVITIEPAIKVDPDTDEHIMVLDIKLKDKK